MTEFEADVIARLDRIEQALVGALQRRDGATPRHAHHTTTAPAWNAPTCFPPYGRSKGQPIDGATAQDLDYYLAGCKRSLADGSKAKFHTKERAMLTAIEAEIARQNGGVSPQFPPASESGAPFPGDDDIPF